MTVALKYNFQVIFLLYLSLPQTFGAAKMYVYYVDPAITKLEEAWAKRMQKADWINGSVHCQIHSCSCSTTE